MIGEHASHEVLAGRIYHIKQEYEEGNEAEISALEHQPEPTVNGRHRFANHRGLFIAPVHPQIEPNTRDEERRRNVENRLRREAQPEQAPGGKRSQRRASSHTDDDYWE